MPKKNPFQSVAAAFFEHDPVAAAKHLQAMDESESLSILKMLPVKVTVNILQYLQIRQIVAFLTGIPAEKFREIVLSLDPRQVSYVIMSLPDEVRKTLIEELDEKTRSAVRELLTFPLNSAGSIMSPDYLAFRKEMRVREAIKKIKALAKKHAPVSYIYVVDADNKLLGVINMRDMMLASGNSDLGSIMHIGVFSVNAFDDNELVANKLSELRYFAAPVVDSENRLLGIIRTEQLIQQVQEEASEDLQKMFGAGGDEKPFSPVWFSLKKRLPWLQINLLTVFLAAFVVSFFEEIIAQITILAVFLPVVAGQGGNAGAQSLAVVMRGLVMREIPSEKAGRMIVKEAVLGLCSGIITGLVTAIVAYLWHGNAFLGLVIGLAMIVSLFVAGISGAAIPIILKKMGFDFAQSSNIILTTITDIVGFFAFLGLAVIFRSYLI